LNGDDRRPPGRRRLIRLGPTDWTRPSACCHEDGTALALTPNAFDLLVYLVEGHGRLVEKNTFMNALWRDTTVEEANVAYNISALRKLLGDGRDNAKFIETVPTRGYRFVAPFVSAEAPATIATAEHSPRLDTPSWTIASVETGTTLADQRSQRCRRVTFALPAAQQGDVGVELSNHPRMIRSSRGFR
jgi:DNA-binding winged helix-turn-helix (wHTH) protein